MWGNGGLLRMSGCGSCLCRDGITWTHENQVPWLATVLPPHRASPNILTVDWAYAKGTLRARASPQNLRGVPGVPMRRRPPQSERRRGKVRGGVTKEETLIPRKIGAWWAQIPCSEIPLIMMTTPNVGIQTNRPNKNIGSKCQLPMWSCGKPLLRVTLADSLGLGTWMATPTLQSWKFFTIDVLGNHQWFRCNHATGWQSQWRHVSFQPKCYVHIAPGYCMYMSMASSNLICIVICKIMARHGATC